MDGYCRGCLSKYEDPTQLFHYSEKSRRLYTYSTGLQVKPNDPLFNMCKHCFIKMKLACKFKKQCRTSDKKFSQFLTMKESGEVGDFDTFLTTHDDSFTFKFPLNGSSTPSFQKAKEDDNESTCTSIRNFMTDILRAEDLPDTEAQIIQEMIEKEADVLNDSLDSHWLADDASIATDFHFSPFSTPSKTALPSPNYSPAKTASDCQSDQQIIDQESFIAAKKILLKTPSPIENYQNVGAKKILDNILVENEVAITIKKKVSEVVECGNDEQLLNIGKQLHIENDQQVAEVGIETVQPKDRIDQKLEEALKDENNTEFPLHSLLAISTPSVKSGLAGVDTPDIADILFGKSNNEAKSEMKGHVYCTDDAEDGIKNVETEEETNRHDHYTDDKSIKGKPSESDPLEDFFNKQTGEYIGETKKDVIEIFGDFVAPKNDINNESDTDFTCKMCLKKFKCKKNLRIHIALKHQGIYTSPTREEVDRRYKPGKSKYDLSDFSCQMCVKQFNSVRALKLHFIKMHKLKIETPKKTEERKEMACDRCGKIFNCKSNLYTHIRNMHKKKKVHTCKSCGLEFSAASKLKMHQVTHTAGQVTKYREATVICIICGRQFTSKSNLQVHEARAHTKQYTAECDLCGQGYFRKYDLVTHMRIHTGEKPFKCQHCPSSFRRRDMLNNHMKLHTGERPHECEFCKSKFRSRPYLNTHLRTSATCIKLRMKQNEEDQDKTRYIAKETTYVPSLGTIEDLLSTKPNTGEIELPDFKEAENLYEELSEIVSKK